MPPARPTTRELAPRWLALGLATAALTVLLDLAGIPSPALFAGLLVGLVAALRSPRTLRLPRGVNTAGQAVVGVALGTYVTSSTLSTVVEQGVPVIAVSVATLALTVVAGLALGRMADVDKPTATFGMVAGGASGIVAIAQELGADPRLVAVMQYLRVLLVVVLTPLVAQGLFSPGASDGGPGAAVAAAAPSPGLLASAAFTLLCVLVGRAVAERARLPAGSLLGPMLLAAALAVLGWSWAGALPALFQDVAFAIIGLQVGLGFTRESLRHARDLLLPTLAAIVVLLVACALLGLLLARWAGVSALDGYLATTPGGLYAVLAAAVDQGANTTFVLAVQVLRLFVMLLAAPLIARRLLRGERRGGRPGQGAASSVAGTP